MNGNYVFTSNIIKRNHLSFDKTNMERTINKKNKRSSSPILKLNPLSLNNEFNYGIHNPDKFLSLSDSKENDIRNQDVIKQNLYKKQEKVGNEEVAEKTKLMEGLKIPSGLLSNPKDNFDVPAYKEQIKRLQGIQRPIENERAKLLNIPVQDPKFLNRVKKGTNIDKKYYKEDENYKSLVNAYEDIVKKINGLKESKKTKEENIERLEKLEDIIEKRKKELMIEEKDNLMTKDKLTQVEHKRLEDLNKTIDFKSYTFDEINNLQEKIRETDNEDEIREYRRKIKNLKERIRKKEKRDLELELRKYKI